MQIFFRLQIKYNIPTGLLALFSNTHLIILGASLSTPNSQKKTYGRPKSAEPGSPLLRRALSPDRLHPRSAETKTSISPLANNVVKVTPRVSIAQSTYPESSDEGGDATSCAQAKDEMKLEKKSSSLEAVAQKAGNDYSKLSHGISINIANVAMSMPNSSQLPRIAEEKDSPTGTKDLVDSTTACVVPGKPEVVHKIVKQIQKESLCESYDVQRKNNGGGDEDRKSSFGVVSRVKSDSPYASEESNNPSPDDKK